MSEVIRLWSGEYEARMRRPGEPPPRPLPKEGATVIILPVISIRALRPPARATRQKTAAQHNALVPTFDDDPG